MARLTDGAQGAGATGGIERIVGFNLRLAHGASHRRFAEALALLDLTQKQVGVLWLVGDHPGIAQIDLGQRLRMDRATTMAVVNRLAARGFVVRERSPSDGRKQALFLTPAGQAALAQARGAVADHEAWLTSRFTAAEVETLRELLARIAG